MPLDGEEYAIHAGEWVELYPFPSMGEIREYQKFRQLSVDTIVAVGEPDEAQRVRQLREAAFDEVCHFLAHRILRWTWTDLRGEPLLPWNDTYEDPVSGEPKDCAAFPPDTEAVARLLSGLMAHELVWLLDAYQGETPKNAASGSDDLATTSSDSASTEAKPSTSGRNRSRASSPKSAPADLPAA